MSKSKIICLCSSILGFFILFSVVVLTGNDILRIILTPVGAIIAVIFLLYASSKAKDYRVNYGLLGLAFIIWAICDSLTAYGQLFLKIPEGSYNFYNIIIICLSFIVDVLITIALIIFYRTKKKQVYSFQLFWDNITIFECSLGLLWILFLRDHYKEIFALHFDTIISFIFICINVFVLDILFSICLSSKKNIITMKYRVLILGIALDSLTDLIQAFLVVYSTNRITHIAYMLSVLCFAIVGLLEVYEPLSNKREINLELYDNVGKIRMSFYLFIAPIIVIIIKGVNLYELVYFLLIILTHYFISIHAENTAKIQCLLNKEKEITAKYELLAKVIEQSPISVVITDINGKIEFCNPYFSHLTGYFKEEVFGKNIKNYRSKEINSNKMNEIWSVIESGKTWRQEFHEKKKNGEKYFSKIIIEPIKNDSGIITNYVFINENITELKEKEEQLSKALVLAQESTKAKSMFLANMSHEIRTPMNAIIGMAYLALKTDLTDKQRDYVSKIHNAATSLLGIINDILDFSKIEADKLSLEHIDFSLEEIISNVSNIISPNAYNKGIEFLSYVHSDVPENLVGDPLRLGQIITNLLNNAVKFTEIGQVSISIEKISKVGNKVELKFKIKDTGIGMKKEEINKLFQPFTQADGSTTRKYGGTGLGLTISKKLLEIMSGDIWVESEYGKGSTFIFTAWFEISKTNSNNRIIPDNLNNLRILVVDDNLSAREIIGEYLKSMCFRVDLAASGEEAITAVKQSDSEDPYALVFMGWQMPDMDGIDAAYIIKHNKYIHSGPRIVMITAFESEEIRKKAEKINIDGYLVKPVNQSVLFDLLINIFDKSSKTTSQNKIFNEVKYKFTDIRLLLAEDNEINSQIAVELLQDKGFIIDTVSNGKNAVLKANQKNYDIILMDLQMPDMDGFQATKLIRKNDKKTPIIAMTARTMVEERERCFEEGMNDHISKPIDPELLFNTIYKWLSEYKKNGLLMMQKEMSGNNILIDKNLEMPEILGINTKQGLKHLANNIKLYEKLLIKYSERELGEVNKLKDAVKILDFAVAKRIIHTIKGVSANIGASEVELYAIDIEKALRIGEKSENIQKMIQKLEIMISDISKAIKEVFNDDINEDTTDIEIDLRDGIKCIKKLRDLLIDNDSEAVDYFNSQRNIFLKCFSKENLRLLKISLDDFNFDKALLLIDENTLYVAEDKGD